jgi:hypothetical protein
LAAFSTATIPANGAIIVFGRCAAKMPPPFAPRGNARCRPRDRALETIGIDVKSLMLRCSGERSGTLPIQNTSRVTRSG